MGAYVGMMSLYAALHVHEVHTIEASLTHQSPLRANIALNPLVADRIRVHGCAVGAADGTAPLDRKAYVDFGSSFFRSVERTTVLQGHKEVGPR